MPTPVRLPPIATDTTEGTLVRWLVAVGERVEAGQILAEVDTAKVLFEVEAPEAGTVLGLVADEGQEIEVGHTLAWLGEPGEAIPDDADRAGGEDVRAAPVVRRLAAELGVDLASLAGSGPAGRIMKEDVQRAAAASDRGATAVPEHVDDAHGLVLANTSAVDAGRMRSAIARATATAWREVPHFYADLEVDTGARDDEIAEHGLTAVLLAAVAARLAADPVLNATYEEGQGVARAAQVNLGVAVAVDGGLVVPVLREADRLTPAEIRNGLEELVERARAGRLTQADIDGVTFTVSNAGMTGVDSIVPIVHRPAVAILGVGARRARPAVVDAAVVPRQTVRLVLACDHRAVDGLEAARWLAELGQELGRIA
jgi:pyruvate dehydrogenase E2 component (dihydrolipoamide acetyltransferase)